jgi:hypothetical protein
VSWRSATAAAGSWPTHPTSGYRSDSCGWPGCRGGANRPALRASSPNDASWSHLTQGHHASCGVGDRRVDLRGHRRLTSRPAPRGRLANLLRRGRGRGGWADPAALDGVEVRLRKGREPLVWMSIVGDLLGSGQGPGGDRAGRSDPRRPRPATRSAPRRRPRPNRARVRGLAQTAAGHFTTGSATPSSTRSVLRTGSPTRSVTSSPRRTPTSSTSAPKQQVVDEVCPPRSAGHPQAAWPQGRSAVQDLRAAPP